MVWSGSTWSRWHSAVDDSALELCNFSVPFGSHTVKPEDRITIMKNLPPNLNPNFGRLVLGCIDPNIWK